MTTAAPATLYHLSLPAGIGRQSHLAEVSAPLLRDVRAVVREGRGNLEGLEVVLRPSARGGALWTLGRPHGLATVECVLCWEPKCCDYPWWGRVGAPREVLEPEAPWLVTTLLPAAAKILSPELAGAVGKVARSVAWALIADVRAAG